MAEGGVRDDHKGIHHNITGNTGTDIRSLGRILDTVCAGEIKETAQASGLTAMSNDISLQIQSNPFTKIIQERGTICKFKAIRSLI